MPLTISDDDSDHRTRVRSSVNWMKELALDLTLRHRQKHLTRSVGDIELKVAPPARGFLLSQFLAHCDLCVWIASSSARL